MARTPDQLRQQGFQALRRELGRSGMIRFLQQFDAGSGNYARDRHDWVDGTSLDQIRTLAGRKRGGKK